MIRKLAFVLAATDHGTMITSRLDYHPVPCGAPHGVGYDILERGAYVPHEIAMTLAILELRCKHYGEGVFALDCGANIGTHTVEWAKKMTSWGSVLAIEPQQRIYYALAGNVALNNCFNAAVIHAAVFRKSGTMKIPSLDHLSPANFGGLELQLRRDTEFIGQSINYENDALVTVQAVAIDDLALSRVDLIKIDVEGMEMDVLNGAVSTIEAKRPVMLLEQTKTNKTELKNWLAERDYSTFDVGANILAIDTQDASFNEVAALYVQQH
jgi:FkbM family methyltransferase